MKKIIVLVLVIAFLMFSFGSMVIAGPGPGSNFVDGISDRSSFEGALGDGNSPGSAPNSGDGIPEGPGW